MASSLRTKLRIAGTVLGCRGFFDAWMGRVLWQRLPLPPAPSPGRSFVAEGGGGREAAVNTHFVGSEAPSPRRNDCPGEGLGRGWLRGALHVHTCTYSDGAGTMEEVMGAAQRAGVDFVLLTDHNTMRPKADGWEEKYAGQDPFLIVGNEITVEGGAFLLALDIPGSFEFPVRRPSQEAIDAVLAVGGLPLVSLPFDMKHPWEDWDTVGCEGLEVLNLSTVAREQINPLSLLFWLLPLWKFKGELAVIQALCARPDASFARWDALLATGQKSIGLGALDAHALMKILGKKYPIPSYENSFKAVCTHVLTEQRTPEAVHTAIRAGKCYFSYDCLGDAAGMVYQATSSSPKAMERTEQESGESSPFAEPEGDESAKHASRGRSMGEDAPLGSTLYVRAPDPKAIVRIYRNGKVVAAGRGEVSFTPTEPGAYRVEVYRVGASLGSLHLNTRPWIFTNPIYIK